jgi:CcmD family protein
MRKLPLLLIPPFLLLGLLPRWARAAGDAAGDYQPYVPGSAEQVSAPLFVVLAYSVIWIVVLLYVLSVWLRQRRVAAELTQVRRELELDELDPPR